MNVSAIIVTRGDHDLTPILDSLPNEWERLVWDNGEPTGFHYRDGNDWRPDGFPGPVTDLSVYGRYAAIEHASGDLIYVQDDDVIVSDPQAILDAWWDKWHYATDDGMGDPVGPMGGDKGVVANMPQPFRHDFYSDHCLVGFGACFHRDLPERAFERLFPDMLNPDPAQSPDEHWWSYSIRFGDTVVEIPDSMFFQRTCDVVFTALTPRVLVDVPYENLPWASDANRMWKQPEHVAERTRMLELVRKVRDAA